MRLCASPVACCNGQKWTEKWNRTRGWQLGEDGRHAGNPGSAGARTPGSRSRYDASSFSSLHLNCFLIHRQMRLQGPVFLLEGGQAEVVLAQEV